LKEEISNLYQQIIEQKNKQIKSLQSKLEEQKKLRENADVNGFVLTKATNI
jgi:predicted RNase H-like nuclease (RuvC/YqgF family)